MATKLDDDLTDAGEIESYDTAPEINLDVSNLTLTVTLVLMVTGIAATAL